ncbi:hypothetical protein [Delftia sp. ASV31]|uniref:hypothetical protein n=1 Tax=Delftia sp. ASV31 TaxID=2795113 RepID=UPI0018EB3C1C|nr:hypothetical protein [Delftia sp. ASV31]
MTPTPNPIFTLPGFLAAAHALLAAQPKGTGYRHQEGVVLLLDGELCLFQEGEGIEDPAVCDTSAWEESAAIEVAALKRRELVQRFQPCEVEAFEKGLV